MYRWGTTLHFLAKSQLIKHQLAETQWWCQLVEMSVPVMLPSIEGIGAGLGEGVWANDIQPRHSTKWHSI